MTQHSWRGAGCMLSLAIGLCVIQAQTALAGNKLTSLLRSISHADRSTEDATSATPKPTFWKRTVRSVSKLKPTWPFRVRHDDGEQVDTARPAYRAGTTAADTPKKPVVGRPQRPVTATPAPTTWSQLRAQATAESKLVAKDVPAAKGDPAPSPPPVRAARQLKMAKLSTMPSRQALAPPLAKTPAKPIRRAAGPPQTLASTPPAKPAVTRQHPAHAVSKDRARQPIQQPIYPQTSPRVVVSRSAVTAPVVSAATYRQTHADQLSTAETQHLVSGTQPAPAGTWLVTYQQLLARTGARGKDASANSGSRHNAGR